MTISKEQNCGTCEYIESFESKKLNSNIYVCHKKNTIFDHHPERMKCIFWLKSKGDR